MKVRAVKDRISTLGNVLRVGRPYDLSRGAARILIRRGFVVPVGDDGDDQLQPPPKRRPKR